MTLTQLFKFKNNKTISKYQNVHHNYKQLHINNMKEQKYFINKAYFLFFSKLNMYFNYLTVCEMSKNSWETGLNFVNLGGRIIFLLCK
jgi:hypothetical protein